MPYTSDISRANPTCFMFLVDQSYSMEGALAGQPGYAKMDVAADTINRVLESLTLRCSQGMDVRDYFDVGILAMAMNRRWHTTRVKSTVTWMQMRCITKYHMTNWIKTT